MAVLLGSITKARRCAAELGIGIEFGFEAQSRRGVASQPDLIEQAARTCKTGSASQSYRHLGMLSNGGDPEWQVFPSEETKTPDWLERALKGLGTPGDEAGTFERQRANLNFVSFVEELWHQARPVQ